MIRAICRHRAVAVYVLLGALTGTASAQTSVTPEAPRLNYKFTVDYFFQASARQSYPFFDDQFTDRETFFWERLRPKLTLNNQQVAVVIEGQDTHTRGSEFQVRTAWFDILNAYVDVKKEGGWVFRLGRRQGDFEATPRLIRTSDFSAVVRSFDVAEVDWQRGKTDVRAFVYRTVDNLPNRFNTWKKGERLWTAFLRQGVGAHSLQTYLTTRYNTGLTSETAVVGNGALYAWQVQANGPLPLPRVSYTLEHILQRGHASTDRIRAAGLFGSLLATARPGQELELRYIRTTGDKARGDGIRGVFDPFYPTTGPMGSLSLMRGSNLHAISIGGTHTMLRKGVFQWRVHDSHVTTTNDGWYSLRFIQRRDATSSRLGIETNAQFTYTFSPKLSTRVGYYRLHPGGYLKSTGATGAPYEVRLQIFGTF